MPSSPRLAYWKLQAVPLPGEPGFYRREYRSGWCAFAEPRGDVWRARVVAPWGTESESASWDGPLSAMRAAEALKQEQEGRAACKYCAVVGGKHMPSCVLRQSKDVQERVKTGEKAREAAKSEPRNKCAKCGGTEFGVQYVERATACVNSDGDTLSDGHNVEEVSNDYSTARCWECDAPHTWVE